MTAPGRRNLITDVDGILVGNAEDAGARTGTTVILPDARAVAAVDTRGGAPGTRETDALDASCLVDAVDAVVLSGGSVYGLDAASGVAAWLGAQGRGYEVPGAPIVAPVVPAAILFDLNNGGAKDWGAKDWGAKDGGAKDGGAQPPYYALGRDAAAGAGADHALGNAGAGYGARAGAYKGGLGSASITTLDGYQVGALAAVNAFGSPVMPGTGTFWAWAHEQNNELGGQQAPRGPMDFAPDWPPDTKTGTAGASGSVAGTNTTIGVVATNAALTPAEAKRLAIMAHDGYARALRPIHTPFDGDVIFALATGTTTLGEPRAFSLARLGMLAADTMARAIARGVYEAKTLGDAKAFRSVFRV